MNKLFTLLCIAFSIFIVSCSSDEPNHQSKVVVYEATFNHIYPGEGISLPSTGDTPQYLESFLPNTAEITEETIDWGSGNTTTHDIYHLELEEPKAKLSITTEGSGIKKFNKQYTHVVTFTPGEYKDKEYPERISIKVTSDQIYLFDTQGDGYRILHNPLQYTSYGTTPWEEDVTLENEYIEQDLSVTKFSETKVSLFNANYFYEFNPKTGLLIQEKPEYNTIGELELIK